MGEMRLIDANALKEKAIRVSTVKEHTYLKAVGTREIDKAPTIDAVSVVRCRDCKHWIRFTDESRNGICCTADCIMYDNDFGSYGERKKGDDHG